MLGNLVPTLQSPGEGQSEGAWSLTGYLIPQGWESCQEVQGGSRSPLIQRQVTPLHHTTCWFLGPNLGVPPDSSLLYTSHWIH